jgi:glutathione synthase/RimK-type ligase-like ATP-grasp enzyme
MDAVRPAADINSKSERAYRVAVVWRGERRNPDQPTHYATRLAPVVTALQLEGLQVETVAYFDETVNSARERLLACDGVLVWINPLADGQDRATVDAMLRDVAAQGIWVSAHPGVIARMGTKEVLYWTRDLSWGSDVDLYTSADALSDRFASKLKAAGPRVLKPHRGNDGQGVLKVEATADDATVRVQHASSDRVETMSFAELFARMAPAFSGGARVIDQAFNPNTEAGMVRCYLSRDQVAGFAVQRPRITDQSAAIPPFGMASSKDMFDADAPDFRELKRAMEDEWVPGMRALLGLVVEDLPAIWDADFLIRPSAIASGNRFVLCEINVSCVSPFPDCAPALIAWAAKDSIAKTAGARRL